MPQLKLGLFQDPYSDSCFAEIKPRLTDVKNKKYYSIFEKHFKKCAGIYSTIVDMLLCLISSQFEQECIKYYAGKGKKFIELHPNMVETVGKDLNRLLGCAVIVKNNPSDFGQVSIKKIVDLYNRGGGEPFNHSYNPYVCKECQKPLETWQKNMKIWYCDKHNPDKKR